MDSSTVIHEFDANICKLRISIPKSVKSVKNCDVFVDEHNFIFVADVDVYRFLCPRKFDIKDMKNIPIEYSTERREYTCSLPCYPEDPQAETIEKDEPNKEHPQNQQVMGINLRTLSRITDSCVLTLDGEVSNMEADFGYGFAALYRGKPKFDEDELAHICRITNPGLYSPIRRAVQREKDEIKDFSADQYKLNFFELQIPDGHENPMQYTMPLDDTTLTKEEESLLHNITVKDFSLKLDSEQINIDCGLVSILLAIYYDIRSTSNDLTCESAWTRTILSSALTYFDRFESLNCVVNNFLRRCLIYPLYRNYDLARLCVEDAVEALEKGKSWIVKQLLGTYICFSQSSYDRHALNKFFMTDYIRYVGKIIDNDHLYMLSRNLKNALLNANKKQLGLGLSEIETELLKELIDDIHLATISESDEDDFSGNESSSSTDTAAESEGETGSDEKNEKPISQI